MKSKHIELLAPAGSFDSLHAAINAGCDSVYFGISELNMRASAAVNFTTEDLAEIVKICKLNNVKTYVTVNTLLYNEEVEKMHKIVDAVKANGADAIIAADMATIMYARSVGVNVHISTQLSISNTESLKFYSQFTDRVVLARELTLEQVKQICVDIKEQKITGPGGKLVEIEVFAHGALCVAVSGRCAMSLYCNNTSANRGKCSQMCRRKYKVVDVDTNQELVVDNNYVMSSADLCTIGMLPELIDAGVSVLKFEGRGRSAEYVDTVISTYRSALNAIEKGEYTQENIVKWNKDLETVFNRGLSKGYYMGRNLDEWSGVHGSKATKEKYYIGDVKNYYSKSEVAHIEIAAKEELHEGDEYVIIGKKTGVVKGNIENMLVNDKPNSTAKQKDSITFKVISKVRKTDQMYVLRDRSSLIPRGRELLIK